MNDLFDDFEKELSANIENSQSEVSKLISDAAERETRWKQRRCGKMTSSNFDPLMTFKKNGQMTQKKGVDYLLQVLHERQTGMPTESIDAYAFRWGHENEPLAHAYYRQVTGVDMLRGETDFDEILFVDNIIEGVGDSPDGRTRDGKGVVEYKCPVNACNHLRNMVINERYEGLDYFWQDVGHMLDPNVEWCDHVSFDPRYPDGHENKIHIVRMYRDQYATQIARLKERLEFYNEVLNRGNISEILSL